MYFATAGMRGVGGVYDTYTFLEYYAGINFAIHFYEKTAADREKMIKNGS